MGTAPRRCDRLDGLGRACRGSGRVGVPQRRRAGVVGLELRAFAEGGRRWLPGWPENSELQLLAEMEHGRFTVERLLSGWALGTRDPGRFLSPYLRPWEDLDDATKQYDCEVIQDLPELLAEAGLGHAPLSSAS